MPIRKLLLFLLIFGTPAAVPASPASILIQFVEFSGADCGYSPKQAGFFLDRWNEKLGQGEIPYEKLLGAEIERKAFHLNLNEIPETNSDWALYFRFFAQHSSTSADHYESVFHLTREWAESLPEGSVRTEVLPLQPTYEPERQRHCLLTFKAVKI